MFYLISSCIYKFHIRDILVFSELFLNRIFTFCWPEVVNANRWNCQRHHVSKLLISKFLQRIFIVYSHFLRAFNKFFGILSRFSHNFKHLLHVFRRLTSCFHCFYLVVKLRTEQKRHKCTWMATSYCLICVCSFCMCIETLMTSKTGVCLFIIVRWQLRKKGHDLISIMALLSKVAPLKLTVYKFILRKETRL